MCACGKSVQLRIKWVEAEVKMAQETNSTANPCGPLSSAMTGDNRDSPRSLQFVDAGKASAPNVSYQCSMICRQRMSNSTSQVPSQAALN
jgi:hypothetical protein